MLSQKQESLSILQDQNTKYIKRVESDFQRYIKDELERRRKSWDIESGEEA
jgi:hypothetical protein